MKKSEFSKNYLDGAIKDTMAFCRGIKETHKINLFEYVRVYDDQTCVVLSNSRDVVDYLFQKEVPLPSAVDITSSPIAPNKKTWYLNEPNGIYTDAIQFFSEKLGAKNCLDLIQRQSGYYELICFGSSLPYETAINRYLNTQRSLEDFAKDFSVAMKQSISLAEKDRIKLPLSMLPRQANPTQGSLIKNLTLESFNTIERWTGEVVYSSKAAKLSKREKESLKFLLLGATASETAKALKLSVRTIEHTLDRIKDKLGCSRKSEIVSILLSSE